MEMVGFQGFLSLGWRIQFCACWRVEKKSKEGHLTAEKHMVPCLFQNKSLSLQFSCNFSQSFTSIFASILSTSTLLHPPITTLTNIYFLMQANQANWSDPLQLGDLTLKNRVFMAALTRERCDPKNGIPTNLLAEYYSQRAGSGFILTQATAWSSRGSGFLGAACLYNRQQLEGWIKSVNAVHSKGGVIFLQIFHAGRVTHPLKNGGQELWAPSALAVREKIRDIGNAQFPLPNEMTLEDIKTVKQEFQESMKLAKQAGFDGVQIHGAHGYLVDEFLRTSSNRRTDHYGGSPENRVRFALELFDIALKYFPAPRLGIKISPASRLKDMYDENPIETYSLLLKELDNRKIGFVEIRESTQFYPFPNLYPLTQREQIPDVCQALRPFYKGLLIGNDSLDEKTGLEKIRAGHCDAVSFGKLYISNPDLAQRIINGWQINKKWDMSTFYGQFGEKGFTDYPFYAKQQ